MHAYKFFVILSNNAYAVLLNQTATIYSAQFKSSSYDFKSSSFRKCIPLFTQSDSNSDK